MNLSQAPKGTIHTGSKPGLCSPECHKATMKLHQWWDDSHFSNKYAPVIVNAHLLIECPLNLYKCNWMLDPGTIKCLEMYLYV